MGLSGVRPCDADDDWLLETGVFLLLDDIFDAICFTGTSFWKLGRLNKKRDRNETQLERTKPAHPLIEQVQPKRKYGFLSGAKLPDLWITKLFTRTFPTSHVNFLKIQVFTLNTSLFISSRMKPEMATFAFVSVHETIYYVHVSRVTQSRGEKALGWGLLSKRFHLICMPGSNCRVLIAHVNNKQVTTVNKSSAAEDRTQFTVCEYFRLVDIVTNPWMDNKRK